MKTLLSILVAPFYGIFKFFSGGKGTPKPKKKQNHMTVILAFVTLMVIAAYVFYALKLL